MFGGGRPDAAIMRIDALIRRPRVLWRFTAGGLALGLALLGAAPVAGAAPARCVGTDVPASGASATAMRSAVVCLVNQQRATRHLPALHSSARLDQSAQLWTNVMIRTASFTHGPDFSGRISATGYFWSSAGENIATGFQTPRQAVAAWMASTDHCQNILDPEFADVGTGVSAQPLGQYGPSTWTQDFGLWMGHRAPSHNFGPSRGCPYRS
jgi:uncharacterized protein YkwD